MSRNNNRTNRQSGSGPGKLTRKASLPITRLGVPVWRFAVLAAFYKVSRNASSTTKRSSPFRDRLFIALSLFRQRPRRAYITAALFRSRPAQSCRPISWCSLGGDGDGFLHRSNHLDHGARKTSNMTYFIMDNFVYGLTKKQTSPTSPHRFKSKTDPAARSISRYYPMKKLIAAGDIHCAHPRRAGESHDQISSARSITRGSSVIECLSECVEFYPTCSIRLTRAKGGSFDVIQEKMGQQPGRITHDVDGMNWRVQACVASVPGVFGVF